MSTNGALRHWEYFSTGGAPVVGATVNVREASLAHPNTGAVVATTTTDANGMWAFTGLDDTKLFDVDVTYLGATWYYKGLSQIGGIFFSRTTDYAALQHAHAAAASGGQVDHTVLTSKGTNTHTQLDSHLSASANVHGLAANVNVIGSQTAAGLAFQHGSVSATVLNGTRAVTGSITFSPAFSAAPYVWLTLDDISVFGAGERPLDIYPFSLAAGGCSFAIDCFTNVGSNRAATVRWLALGTP